MATDAEVDALRRSIDLGAYISQYLELKKNGTELRALCPFHTDHNPSLTINPAKQVWACFSCGAHEHFGADLFGFVRSYFDCTFAEAIEKLKGSNGATGKPIVIPPRQKPPPRALLVPPADSHPDMARGDLGEPVKVWTIRASDGAPWFYEARYLREGKKQTRFWTYGRYSQTDPPRWECRHPPNPRPLYGLDALSARAEAQVMIHEAPKKAEVAAALFPALVHVALLGGAQQVGNTDLTPLAARRVFLLPDNDEAGKQAMRRLAARLMQELGMPKVWGINPETQPDETLTPDGWDVADSTGWSPETALEWAKARKFPYEPWDAGENPAQEAPRAAISAEPIPWPRPGLRIVEGNALRKPVQELEEGVEQLPAFSEFALAQRFVDQLGADWRYTAAWSSWARWKGYRWESDECKAITWEVKNCCSAALAEHVAESTPSQRIRLTTLKTVNAVMGIACADPRVAVAPLAWDAHPMLLGTPGGVIDLRTGLLTGAERGQMISRSTSVAPATGPHPWWDRVLGRAHRGDPAFLAFMQRWCGYILTGDTREERFLFIHGPGAGGKSKFLTPLAEIMGDYRRNAGMDTFTSRQRQEHSEEIARLAGARLVTASETEESSRWNEARITALTGRDSITARHMHKSSFEFSPQFKLIFVGNHRPALRSVGEEMRRRIDLIEWGGTIPEAERVLDLPEKLRAEYPAILAWMIEGCLAWQRIGLGKPAPVESATREYLSSEDTIGAWLEECAIVEGAARAKSSAGYLSFKRWAEQSGEYVPSQKRFTQRMRDRGFATLKSGAMYLLGLRLKSEEEPDPRSASGWLPDD